MPVAAPKTELVAPNTALVVSNAVLTLSQPVKTTPKIAVQAIVLKKDLTLFRFAGGGGKFKSGFHSFSLT